MATNLPLGQKRSRVVASSEYDIGEAEFDEIWATYISEDAFAHASLFAVTEANGSGCTSDSTTAASTKHKKRSREGEDATSGSTSVFGTGEQFGLFQDLRNLFPELYPKLPSLEHRPTFAPIENPYLEGRAAVAERHPHLRVSRCNTTAANGYLKFVMSFKAHDFSEVSSGGSSSISNDMAIHHRQLRVSGRRHDDVVARLPPGFGSNAKIDAVDRNILRFYTAAVCGGRTLLPKTNAWLDLGSVIDSDDCARHAALAFSAGYLLDYIPSERFRVRANYHYKRASELLTLALNDPGIHDFGKEDGVITALHLLWSDDVVQWELRRPKNVTPRWRCGTQTAKAILDNTDPGYRYWHSENVQTTSVRRSNANMCAYAEICALPITRPSIEDFDKLYPWLLAGTEEEVREIFGGTGVCPKVLHVFAQITQLSARILNDPESPILPHWADAIMSQLTNFRQISELSRGYETTEELLESCELDKDGLVQCAIKVTELTAETWVQAAQIYLCCRFYRLPRYHPKVLHSLSVLLRCVERMPTSGHLFTAQSPFFCIFMAGLVAYRNEDRLVLRQWFDVIVSRASGRSSVPPIYETLKQFWNWIDSQPYAVPKGHMGNVIPLGERVPWWEYMVEWFLENYGELSLV